MNGWRTVAVVAALLFAIAPNVAARALETKVTVLQSLNTTQTYQWFRPGYASSNCTGRATANASGSSVSANGSLDCEAYLRPPTSGTTRFTGHVLYLQLSDYRVIVVSCDRKVTWTDWNSMWRDCRLPQCTTCDATISGNKVKLSWPVSLDGRKKKGETYKIESVLQPN